MAEKPEEQKEEPKETQEEKEDGQAEGGLQSPSGADSDGTAKE